MTTGTPSTHESCGRLAGSRASNLLKACGSRWTGTGETTPGGGPERVPTSGATTRKTTEAYRQTPSLDSVRILVTGAGGQLGRELIEVLASHEVHGRDHRGLDITDRQADRKSTRLNSSHANISYAVFCLKKKKKKITHRQVKIIAEREKETI